MSNQSLGARVHEQLKQAVASKRLPEPAQERAEHLLSRIEQPVRLALMGLPSSGKSSLLNLLVGSEVVPEGVRLPSLQLTYGDEAKATCTLADGSQQTLISVDPSSIAEQSPVFVDLQLPLPALRKISVLEVVAPEDKASMHRASQWAAKRADVALWCTQGFNALEQALWSVMPDLIKDHAFLMITKADFLKANGMLEASEGTIRNTAQHEFNKIMPIATLDAIGARDDDGNVDKAALKASGGTALISAVLKQVDQGRQTAIDMADMLMHQNMDVLADIMTAEDVPADAPKTTAKAKPKAKSKAKPKAAAKKADTPADIVTLQPSTRDAYESAVSYIVAESQAMLKLAEGSQDGAPAKIIAKTVENMQWLSEHLNDNGDAADERLQIARNAAMDAADLVQLMQMEKSDSAAIEALSLLLQIKHELQADLAA
ncbi:hypothetical protein [Yoonia sp. SS1-5]|uniref:G domain-containing protein n=1 Tax=Yoonia rhodophyticola TaxID=3137370 RepID=A0AAN0NL93_9RHOB